MRILIHVIVVLVLLPSPLWAGPSPKELIAAAIDNWRDSSSYTESSMTVHRPDWERKSAFRGWTQGRTKSLIQFTEPARDKGNASLRVDNSMWSYSPKVNRVIKIPASMMAQSWMGSDFSYQDLSRSDDLLVNYSHKLLNVAKTDGHDIYKIEARPLPQAAVVWGKEEISIRDDYVMMEHAFYDQEMKLVKVMKTFEVGRLGGKMYPIRMRMIKLE
ncbi:MAG: outer membrane lipoprotein-sorting protein, partial [Bdellovibrionales bacterium]|nr:outer membrane lipoprotein-sorting protein [Bdellovibrionales bacterium]